MARKISVEIVGDSRSLERAFARSSKSAKNFNRDVTRGASKATGIFRGLSGAAAAFGVTLGAAGAVAGIRRTIDLASDLNEQTNRSRVLFGRASKATVAWSKTTADSIGISSAAALEGAGNFGAMFETVGLADKPAAQMSRRFVTLAADMASFNNVDPSDMLDRLRSGLAGEAEPLRRFGVLLSEARVKQEAYRSGLARTGAKLTEGQKVLARYQLILKDTAVQQEDFQRTSTGWANVQRRLSALIQDTGARIGGILLPNLRELANRFANWLANTRNQQRVQRTLNSAIKTAGAVARTFKDVLSGLADIVRPLVGALGGTENAVKLLVIAFGGLKLGKLITGFQGLGTAATGARGGPTSGLMGLDAAALALGFTLGDLAVKKVPGFESFLTKFGEKVSDAFHHAGVQLGIVDSEAEALQKHIDAVTASTARLATGFGAREGPEGGFPVFDSTKRRKRKPKPGVGGAAGAAAPRGIPVELRNRIFDAMVSRQLDRLQDMTLRKQLARLKEIDREVLARKAVTKDATRRLTLEDQHLEILRQQRSVQAEIADQIQAGNSALKDRADAIKSAVIERLQRRQTDVLNRRALADAKEQLRIAKQIGGPKGVRAAMRGLQDVRMDILQARVERARPTLTPRRRRVQSR